MGEHIQGSARTTQASSKDREETYIDNDHIFEIAAETTQIFHKYAVVENAVFSEETVGRCLGLVELLEQRIRILAEGGGVDHDFIERSHAL